MNVGIVGCGFVGDVLRKWLKEHNSNVTILISDPKKGYDDDLMPSDIVFISIHIPTEYDNTQDLTVLRRIVSCLPDKPIFIRTTVLPGTCSVLSRELKKNIYFMPEFLTERTAYEDFCTQPMVFTGKIELLKGIFLNKKFITMSSLEAEVAKYTHNVFGAMKVTYFNAINEISAKMNISYENVLSGVLTSGYINTPHTQVPGPDGHFGYGGKCFPKDVDAFTKFCENTSLHTLLKNLNKINKQFRNKSQIIHTLKECLHTLPDQQEEYAQEK